jgi:hypothetical protein
MSRLRSAAFFAVAFVLGTILVAGRLAPTSLAQTPDRSEIVLVLDFSASILEDVTNRDRFAAALDRIADRVDATTADLVVGDATVTIVQFATNAADYPGCVELKLLDSPATVARFADCLRDVAKAYRKGLDPALTRRIGDDTNYVAAMEQAAKHLAIDAVRPALVLLTDGKHDVAGVPVSQVQPALERLFGDRSPFALLPVGMGLDPAERDALEAGLLKLRIIRDMPACISGAQFSWPQVVFESPAEAGNAVAVALQDVTCTFTVAPTPTPTPVASPSPTPTPAPTAVRGINLTPGDGRIEVTWTAPASLPASIVDYRTRCRSGDGEWTESGEGTSLETSAVVEGLTNGLAYQCEVAAVNASGDGEWTAAAATITPVGRPGPPAKPIVEALDHGVQIQLPVPDPLVSTYRYECSGDQGTTWPAQIDLVPATQTTTTIGNLTNGIEYLCRAYAENPAGISDPSEPSNAVRPCSSLIDCNPVVAPILGGVGLIAALGLLGSLLALFRSRTRGYVIAVVDVVHTANLGYGSRLGIRITRDSSNGPVNGIVGDRSRRADLRIRPRGGDRFEVSDRAGTYSVTSGEPVVWTDSQGVRHSVILRRFHTATASPLAGQR